MSHASSSPSRWGAMAARTFSLSETTRRYDLPEVQGLLPAGGTLRREARFVVPELPERTWQVGFTVSNLPVTTWFNGPTERIRTIAK